MALSIPEIEALRDAGGALRELLQANRYSLDEIAALVGESDPTSFVSNAVLCALAYDAELTERDSALACLARLFLLGARVDEAQYRAALPPEVRAHLETNHLVVPCGPHRVTSNVTIGEYGGTYLISDKLLEVDEHEISLEQRQDVVWPMAEWSLALLLKLEERPAWRSLLDVGCGNGCLSLITRQRYSAVVGIDLNPRAVAFARLNCALGRTDARYAVADCLEYIAPTGTTYDHIVFAAPSGPGDDGSVMVTSGGRLGHELAMRFVSERMPDLLSPDGCCQVWAIFAVEERDGSVEALFARSLPPNRFDVTVDATRSGGLYVSREHVRTGTVPDGCHYVMERADVPRFMSELRANGVAEIVSAVVTLRPKR